MENLELAIIGGGPAGLAAAVEAYDKGIRNMVIIERDKELGGILNQCIHTGFGLHLFGEELSGPEYAYRFCKEVEKRGISCLLNTMVLHIAANKTITVVGKQCGLLKLHPKAIVLAMGCRERSRGAIRIAGSRPAGVLTAGTAQRFINREGYAVGRQAVILGSGDIGLIMARRLSLEGAQVQMVCELEPYSNGLERNIVQCLHDFHIPLLLSCTVVEIVGKSRLEGVFIAQVDENKAVMEHTRRLVPCDTLLLSVGLIPENECSKDAGIAIDIVTGGPSVSQSMETSVQGIFACGNGVHVHDLVDFVTMESTRAGAAAARFVQETAHNNPQEILHVRGVEGVRYVVPQRIEKSKLIAEIPLFFRVDKVYRNVTIEVKSGDNLLSSVQKQRLLPGEMESVPFLPKQAKRAQGELIVRLVQNAPQREGAAQ